MYSVNLVLELSLSFTKFGLADQFLEITLPCWKSSLRGRSRRFEKESPRSISWRKKGCCAIGRGGVKVVSAIGRGRVKGVSASELLPCRCLIKMPSIVDREGKENSNIVTPIIYRHWRSWPYLFGGNKIKFSCRVLSSPKLSSQFSPIFLRSL